jgi:hypothetical protein
MEVLREIHRTGKLNYDRITRILFDEDGDASRNKAYARVDYFKKKGWISLVDGDWVVDPTIFAQFPRLKSLNKTASGE